MRALSFATLFLITVPAIAGDRFVTTRGEVTVEVPPEFVEIGISLLAVGTDLDRLKADVDGRAQQVLAAAAKLEIAGADIESSGVTVEREYETDRNDNEILRGYRVTRDIDVKLRAIARYEELAQALVDARVDAIEDVTVGVDDRDALKERALVSASRNARKKADAIASELGIKLGLPIEIGEDKLWLKDALNERAGAMYGEVIVTANLQRQTPVVALVFQPHQIKVDAVVWARFEILSKD